jgi:hypothetical protein
MRTFIIPTLGRLHNQITYNNMPQSVQARTRFVVQQHEAAEAISLFGESRVDVLPSTINRIGPTRQWIWERYRGTDHAVFDDDIKVTHRGDDKKYSLSGEAEWELLESTIDQWHAENIHICALGTTWAPPPPNPYADNGRIMTNWWFSSRLNVDMDWTRVPAGEDLDVVLQTLTQRIKNRISYDFLASVGGTNSAGGCSTWRDVEVHNASQRKLAELWPDFVRTREKEVKSGPWKGQKKINVTLFCKRAYESSVKTVDDTFNSLFE